MTKTTTHGLEFLRALNRAVRSLKMYKATHPQVVKDMDVAFISLRNAFAVTDAILVGVSGGVFLIDGKPQRAEAGALKGFSDLLEEKNITNFRIAKTATKEEFTEFARILFMEPEEAMENDEVKPALLSGLRSFKINVGGVVTATPAGGVESVSALADAYMKAREDPLALLDRQFQALKEQPSTEAVVAFFDAAGKELAKVDPASASQKAKQYLDQAATEVLAAKGMDELRSSIVKLVMAMSPDMRRWAFGEALGDSTVLDAARLLRRLPAVVRGAALLADLQRKAEPERLRASMEALAPAAREYVGLCDEAAVLLHESTPDSAAVAEALSRLFAALKARAGVVTRKAQGTVLVLDPDAIGEGGYAGEIEAAGYTVLRHGDGMEALEDLGKRTDVQCLVMEIKVPGLSGLEILSGLVDQRRVIPVLVVSQTDGFRDAFEVASYPKLAYLTKPADTARMLDLIEQFIPAPAADSPEPASAQDVARAKEVQECATAAAEPKVDGYDVAIRTVPANGTGGDCVDVLLLDGGRVGLLVATVGAKEVLGAMVVLMLRTSVRVAALRSKGAKATLVEANRLLAKCLPKGVEVSAAYAELDTGAGTLTVAAAGHHAPLLWTKDMGIASFLSAGATRIGGGAGVEESLAEESAPLAPRDRLLLYTRGLVGAKDPKGAPFGEKRFLKLVNFGGEKTGGELLDGVLAEVEKHRAGQGQMEDLTLLCLTRGS